MTYCHFRNKKLYQFHTYCTHPSPPPSHCSSLTKNSYYINEKDNSKINVQANNTHISFLFLFFLNSKQINEKKRQYIIIKNKNNTYRPTKQMFSIYKNLQFFRRCTLLIGGLFCGSWKRKFLLQVHTRCILVGCRYHDNRWIW